MRNVEKHLCAQQTKSARSITIHSRESVVRSLRRRTIWREEQQRTIESAKIQQGKCTTKMSFEQPRKSLLIAVAATYIGGACGWGIYTEDSVAAQRRLSWHKQRTHTRRKTVETNITADHIIDVTVASRTVLAKAHPKITAAPVIKRKLGSTRWETTHKRLQAQERDGETCQKDYQMCPKELGGGCCPKDRACGTSSCLPLTATGLACGRENYIACGIEAGGGCCPSKHECGRNGCTPLPGAVSTLTCSANSYLCPAAVNYGCCKSGMACGVENCYSTEASTFTITQVVTTTNANAQERTTTTTITSTTTSIIPSETATQNIVAGIVPKISAAADSIPKTSATAHVPSSLSSQQLGGIIGGAVALLVVLLVAAFLIIRRLNKAIELSETKSRRRASELASAMEAVSRKRSMSRDIDAASIDPLVLSPSGSTEMGGTPRWSSHTSPYEAEGSPVFRSPFSPQDVTPQFQKRGYNRLAEIDSNPEWDRHTSVDSVATIHQTNRRGSESYFDIPVHDRRRSSQNTYIPGHGRQWSNASEVSELEAGVDGNRRTSMPRSLHSLGRSLGRRRTNSGEVALLSETHDGKRTTEIERDRTKPDWTPPVGFAVISSGANNGSGGRRESLGHTLGFIDEAGESRVRLGDEGESAGSRR